MRKGTVMGPKKGNLLIAVANAFMNLTFGKGVNNAFHLSEQNSILTIEDPDAGQAQSNGTGGSGTFRGDWDLDNLSTFTGFQVGDTIIRTFTDTSGNIYIVPFVFNGVPGLGTVAAPTGEMIAETIVTGGSEPWRAQAFYMIAGTNPINLTPYH